MDLIGVEVHDNPEINTLETTVICNDSTMIFKTKDIYLFKDVTHLILIPIEPGCDEACAFLFNKIDEE